MLDSSKFFTPLTIKSGELFVYLNDLCTQELPWVKHFGFDAIEINSNWIKKDHTLSLINQLQPIKKLGLLRIPPYSFYRFHQDEYRLSTVNMLVKGKDSHCFFIEHRDNYYSDCLELVYQPRVYYLFNNQAFHGVTNNSEPRFMFSLYFENEIKYTDLQVKLLSLAAK